MAIIIRGKSKCALCENVIGDRDEIVATSHFISEQSDPLWRYSDAPFHFACFQKWDMRELFVAKFNEVMKTSIFGSGKQHHMRSDGLIETVQVEETPEEGRQRVRSFLFESLRERNVRRTTEYRCSFCDLERTAPVELISGFGMTICSECIARLNAFKDSESWKLSESDSQCAVCCMGGKYPDIDLTPMGRLLTAGHGCYLCEGCLEICTQLVTERHE